MKKLQPVTNNSFNIFEEIVSGKRKARKNRLEKIIDLLKNSYQEYESCKFELSKSVWKLITM